MYFSVKYIDLKTFDKLKDLEVFSYDLTDDAKRVLNVQNKELIVNPDCFMGIIMDYIFEEVGISEDKRAQFDMMNCQGKLLSIHNYAPTFSGLSVFDDKQQYYVALCENAESKPLLNKLSQEYYELFEPPKKKARRRRSQGSIRASKASNISCLQKISSIRSLRGSPSRARQNTDSRYKDFI